MEGGRMDISDYMTGPETAKLLGVTRQAVHLMLKRGTLKGERHGGMWFIHKNEVEKAKKRKEVA
jgi:excisionase family DNA binding protein